MVFINIAFLFSGQGSQYSGMGKDFYDHYEESRDIFNLAGEDVSNACFFSSDEELSLTKNTQPCVFTVSMAMYEVFKNNINLSKINITAFAGHSLGEYSALCAAGAFSFEEGLKLVRFRAETMEKASLESPGGMAAVLGEDAGKLISSFSPDGHIEVANYNCPGQTVISGDKKTIDKFTDYCKEQGVKCVPLAVSGAFHSKLMDSAEKPLFDYLNRLNLKFPEYNVFSNSRGDLFRSEDFIEDIAVQVCKPVLFEQCVRKMISLGAEIFIEFGPKKTLAPMIKRIDKGIASFSINSVETLKDTIQKLGI